MKFGLKEKIISQISQVFSSHPEIDKVVIYGSRAKNTYKRGSDIDLSLKGKTFNLQFLGQIRLELDDLLLPYMFDVSIFDQIENPDLLEHIERVGKVFYRKAEKRKS